jgi:hypothetical protein
MQFRSVDHPSSSEQLQYLCFVLDLLEFVFYGSCWRFFSMLVLNDQSVKNTSQVLSDWIFREKSKMWFWIQITLFFSIVYIISKRISAKFFSHVISYFSGVSVTMSSVSIFSIDNIRVVITMVSAFCVLFSR